LASAQTAPHAPQFAGSMARLAQKVAPVDPHVASGAAQVVPHAPPEQTWPAAHVAVHDPQWALSERASTSQPSAGLALQSRKPVAHIVMAHAPVAQNAAAWGSAQVRPQTPQLAVVALRSVSQPLAATPSQSPKPAAQRTTVHAPAAQPFAATWASAQSWPQLPQFAGSIATLAQNALGAVPQVRSGDAQVVPHTPPEHT
jgi:hypothetical protein